MIVEEVRVDRESYGKFPAGLRVLAVDDNPICLKLLDTLLRKCQYHVTTTSQARMALNMLRENKDRFDLVISDVNMPYMDGFKLLELVGLEMDLPVIMLSANSDSKLVMKGVSHGACDYLVKPVRIEELRNIWQHVLRRKNFESKYQNASSDQISSHPTGGGHVSPTMGKEEQNGKFYRKRKEEEDESEDNMNDSEDPTTQKKPRVVWSIELHRKFVAAVNQLGIEKAVPKRILDMMNVEGLTRENVASHLQKYRLYLKRISHVTTQQANMAASLGINDSPFMRMGSLDGLGDFRSLVGPGRLSNISISSYATGGMLGRLNSPASMNLLSLTPSTIISHTHAPNLNSITSVGKTHPVLSSTCQRQSLFQGIPSSLELDQLKPKSVINFNGMDDSRMLTTFNAFTDPGAINGSSIGLFSSTANNNMMLFNLESFNSGVTGSSNLLDPGKCDEMWRSSVESSKIQPNSMISTNSFHSQLSVNIRDNSSDVPFSHNNSMISSLPIQDSRETASQDMQNMNQTINHRWREQRQNYGIAPNINAFGSLNSQIPFNNVLPPLNRIKDQSNGMFNQKMDVFGNGRLNGGALNAMQQNENDKSGLRSSDNFPVEQIKVQSGFIHQSYDSLDDLMNAMIKQEHDETMPNYDFEFDDYAFGQVI